MSWLDMAYTLAKGRIQATRPFQAFDKARRKTVRKALLLALEEAERSGAAGPGRGALLEAVLERHLDSVAEAGFPLLELLKMFGVEQLQALAKSLAEQKEGGA